MRKKEYNPRTAPSCCFNPGVECDGPDARCPGCGWNPKERRHRADIRLSQTRHKDMTIILANGDAETFHVQFMFLRR